MAARRTAALIPRPRRRSTSTSPTPTSRRSRATTRTTRSVIPNWPSAQPARKARPSPPAAVCWPTTAILMAMVTIHVTKRVLYVKNNGGGSTGRVDSPYATLAAAQAASADNDTVYVFTGDGTTAGQSNGITLNHNGERLIGEGVALKGSGVYNGATNPQLRAAGMAPKMSNVAGAGVTISGVGTLSNN